MYLVSTHLLETRLLHRYSRRDEEVASLSSSFQRINIQTSSSHSSAFYDVLSLIRSQSAEIYVLVPFLLLVKCKNVLSSMSKEVLLSDLCAIW